MKREFKVLIVGDEQVKLFLNLLEDSLLKGLLKGGIEVQEIFKPSKEKDNKPFYALENASNLEN